MQDAKLTVEFPVHTRVVVCQLFPTSAHSLTAGNSKTFFFKKLFPKISGKANVLFFYKRANLGLHSGHPVSA